MQDIFGGSHTPSLELIESKIVDIKNSLDTIKIDKKAKFEHHSVADRLLFDVNNVKLGLNMEIPKNKKDVMNKLSDIIIKISKLKVQISRSN